MSPFHDEPCAGAAGWLAPLFCFLFSQLITGATAHGQQPRADVLDTAEVRSSRIISL